MESFFRAMGQNTPNIPPNFAATNNTVVLQMAMAQEMMQQQQQQQQCQAQMGNFNLMDQARMFAQQQQQNQMSLLTNTANNGFNMGGQQASTNPEEQRLLAAMFLDRLNKQQQQQQQHQQQQQQQQQQPQQQQQQQQQQVAPNTNQQQQQIHQQGLGSMSTIASLTPSMVSNPSVGLSNFNFGTHQAPNTAVAGNDSQQQDITSNNDSSQFLPADPRVSDVSLNTLVGDTVSNSSTSAIPAARQHPQLSYPNGGGNRGGGSGGDGEQRGRPTDSSTSNPIVDYMPQNSATVDGANFNSRNIAGGIDNQGHVNKKHNITEAFC